MSRIFALVSRLDAEPAHAEPLAARLARHDGWEARVARAGNAILGWAGPRAASPGLASTGTVTAVIDGRLLDVAGSPGGEAAARILIERYEALGWEGALKSLHGECAAALHDARTGELWLGRDRIGLKPLYWASTDAAFAAASQPAPLLELPGIRPEPDRRFVARYAGAHYRVFDNDPEHSPYADIRQLPAAHLLAAGDQRPRRWWALADQADFTEPQDELATRYRELLLDAVGIRLRAAQRPAFTLSGGMDSSSILACAAAIAGGPLPAYSGVYEDETFDERDEIADMLGTHAAPWRPVMVDEPDLAETVRAMVEIHEEPVATATWLTHFALTGHVGAHGHDALFGGMGGDELNAGEYEYFPFHFADLRAQGREEDLRHEVARWARHHDHPIHRKDPQAMEAALRRLVDPKTPGRCLPDLGRLARYHHTVLPAYYDLRGDVPVMEHPFASYLKNRAYQDLTRETAPCCLRAEDRHTNAAGLERFDPFLDHRLVEFAFRVPGHLKIRDGVTKRLLREAMRGLLPDATRSRVKKTGWNAPAHLWFTGSGADHVRDLIRSAPFESHGVYDRAAVDALLDEHELIVRSGEPRENHMMFLWQLVNLETWLTWLDERA